MKRHFWTGLTGLGGAIEMTLWLAALGFDVLRQEGHEGHEEGRLIFDGINGIF
jgi:hypothetical protein